MCIRDRYEGGAGAEAEVGDVEARQAGRDLVPGAAGEIQHTEVDAPVAGDGASSRQGQAAVGGVDAITQEDVAAVAGAEGQPGVEMCIRDRLWVPALALLAV